MSLIVLPSFLDDAIISKRKNNERCTICQINCEPHSQCGTCEYCETGCQTSCNGTTMNCTGCQISAQGDDDDDEEEDDCPYYEYCPGYTQGCDDCENGMTCGPWNQHCSQCAGCETGQSCGDSECNYREQCTSYCEIGECGGCENDQCGDCQEMCQYYQTDCGYCESCQTDCEECESCQSYCERNTQCGSCEHRCQNCQETCELACQDCQSLCELINQHVHVYVTKYEQISGNDTHHRRYEECIDHDSIINDILHPHAFNTAHFYHNGYAVQDCSLCRYRKRLHAVPDFQWDIAKGADNSDVIITAAEWNKYLELLSYKLASANKDRNIESLKATKYNTLITATKFNGVIDKLILLGASNIPSKVKASSSLVLPHTHLNGIRDSLNKVRFFR